MARFLPSGPALTEAKQASGVQTYNEASIESEYTGFIDSSCGYPGFSYFTYLSRKQEQFAKTVTACPA